MSLLLVEKALVNSVLSLGLLHPIIQENATKKQIDEAQSSDFHLELFGLGILIDPLTKEDLDGYTSVFQITINGPLNVGKAPILTLADTILAAYKTGQTYTNGGCTVEISSSSTSTPGISGSYYSVDLSIEWFAYIDR